MRSTPRKMLATIGGIGLAAAVAASPASAATTYTTSLNTLNSAFGSTAHGAATVSVDESGIASDRMSGTATVHVQLNASGLEDLSNISGAIHVGHIHGQFASNAGLPPAQQRNGAFFQGEGGTPVDSKVPTAANADDNVDDGFIDFFEGLPRYGPVVLNLSTSQIGSPPSGTSPLDYFVQQAGAGNIDPAALFPNGTTFNVDTTYSFDLANQDQRRQYNNLVGPNGGLLADREIVLHGLVVPRSVSDAIDAAVGLSTGDTFAGVPLPGPDGQLGTADDLAFRITAPVAAGELTAVPTPTAAIAGFGLLGGLALRRRRRQAA